MPLTYYTHARRDEPKVALTFDDGPNPPRTDEIPSKPNADASPDLLRTLVMARPVTACSNVSHGKTTPRDSFVQNDAQHLLTLRHPVHST